MKKTIILFALALLAARNVHADPGTLSVSPAVVMLKGVAGQSTTQSMTILNGSSVPLSFDMVARDVVVKNGKRTFVNAGELPGSVAATAVFSPKSLNVAPGEKRTVEVTVTLPPQPAARAVVALFQGTTKLQRNGTQVTASLGTLLTFALSDNGTAEASPLVVHAPTATTNLNVGQQLANGGSEPVLAQGMLAILNSAGTLVAKQAMTPRRLLPGEKLDMSAEYGGELQAGHYRALVTYVLQNNKTVTSGAEFDVR
ncbi:MAG: hypothetical protein JOZ54_06410 [Acidobacteria bacterium]|nr:hypothetical protein [Acidobacteriota bacterium]